MDRCLDRHLSRGGLSARGCFKNNPFVFNAIDGLSNVDADPFLGDSFLLALSAADNGCGGDTFSSGSLLLPLRHRRPGRSRSHFCTGGDGAAGAHHPSATVASRHVRRRLNGSIDREQYHERSTLSGGDGRGDSEHSVHWDMDERDERGDVVRHVSTTSNAHHPAVTGIDVSDVDNREIAEADNVEEERLFERERAAQCGGHVLRCAEHGGAPSTGISHGQPLASPARLGRAQPRAASGSATLTAPNTTTTTSSPTSPAIAVATTNTVAAVTAPAAVASAAGPQLDEQEDKEGYVEDVDEGRAERQYHTDAQTIVGLS